MSGTLKPLPALKEGQSWSCVNGCGECKPALTRFEYSREEDLNGNLIRSDTTWIWTSDCCEDDVLIWDETLQDVIYWEV